MEVRSPLERTVTFWYVGFVDHGANVWWHRFLRRGFRHCFAIGYDEQADVWVLFDALLDGFNIRVLPRSDMDALIGTYTLIGGRFVAVEVSESPAIRAPRLLATCVTAIAHMTGVRGCALSPYGLYRKLLRQGGRELDLKIPEG